MTCPPHHWVIDEPCGPTSRGTCDCGAERWFPNSDFMDRDWHVEPIALKGSTPRRRGKPVTVALGRERVFSQHWEGPK